MDREKLIAKLEEFGWSREILDKMPDEALAEAVRVADTGDHDTGLEEEDTPPDHEHPDLPEEDGSPGAGPGDEPPAPNESPEDAPPEEEAELQPGGSEQEQSRGEPVEEYDDDPEMHGQGGDEEDDEEDDFPEPANDEERQAYAAHCRKMAAKLHKMIKRYSGGSQSAGTPRDPGLAGQVQRNPNPHIPEPPAGSTGSPKKVTMSAHYSETQKALQEMRQLKADIQKERKALQSDRQLVQKFNEEVKISRRKEMVDAVLSRNSDKIPPVMRPHYRKLLTKADARSVVRTFSEKGRKVELTEFDQIVREIDALPSKFAERFKEPAKVSGGSDSASDREAWAKDTYQSFSETAMVHGSVENFVDAVKKMPESDWQEFRSSMDKRRQQAA